MTRGVLWDSSAILALLDADDADHARAIEVARQVAVDRRPSFITNYIEAEAHALLLRELGRTVARQWLLRGAFPSSRCCPPRSNAPRTSSRVTSTRTGRCATRSRSPCSMRGASRARSPSTTTFASTDGSRFLAWTSSRSNSGSESATIAESVENTARLLDRARTSSTSSSRTRGARRPHRPAWPRRTPGVHPRRGPESRGRQGRPSASASSRPGPNPAAQAEAESRVKPQENDRRRDLHYNSAGRATFRQAVQGTWGGT